MTEARNICEKVAKSVRELRKHPESRKLGLRCFGVFGRRGG
jgi:hypothetical protein